MIIPDSYGQANVRYGGPALPNGAEWTMGLLVGNFVGTVADAADAFVAALTSSAIMNRFSVDAWITSVLMKFGPNATGPQAEVAANIVGSQAGGAVPPNVSVLVSKITDFGGRTGRGRFYLPGMRETDVTGGGQLDSGIVTSINSELADLLADLIAADLEPVLLHSEGSPVTTPRGITSFQCSSTVATQRRRLRP